MSDPRFQVRVRFLAPTDSGSIRLELRLLNVGSVPVERPQVQFEPTKPLDWENAAPGKGFRERRGRSVEGVERFVYEADGPLLLDSTRVLLLVSCLASQTWDSFRIARADDTTLALRFKGELGGADMPPIDFDKSLSIHAIESEPSLVKTCLVLG
jgi:hypothetical protein